MADYRVDIDVNVDDSKLDALESRIKSLNKDNVIKAKVELDDSALKASFKNNNKKNNTVKFTADSGDFTRVFAHIQTSLKQASKAGKIKLDFDDNGAVKGINNIQQTIRNGEVVQIKVDGVDSLGRAFTAIQNLEGAVEQPIDIKINTKNIEQVKTVTQEIQERYKKLISTINEIGKTTTKIEGLDKSSKEAEDLRGKLRDLISLKEELENGIISRNNGVMPDGMAKGIEEAWSKVDDAISSIQSKALDKSNVQYAKDVVNQVESEYKELKNIIRDIGSTKLKLVGLDEASAEAKELTAELQRLEVEKNKISGRVSGWLTDSQKGSINTIESANEKNISRKQAQLTDKSNVFAVNAAYKELIATMREIGGVRVQLQGLDEGSRQAEKLAADLARLKEKAQNIFDSNSFSGSQMTGINNVTDKIDSDLENAKNKIIDARAEAAKGIELKVNSGDITKDFAKVSDGMHRLGDYSNEVEAEYNDLIAKSKELANSLDGGDYNKIIAANEEYIKSLDKLENKLQTVSIMKKRADEQDKAADAQNKLRQDATTFSLSIDAWLKNNSAAEKEFGSTLRSLQMQLRSCDAVQFNNLKSQFNQLKLVAEQAGKTGLNFKDRLQMQFTRLAGYFGASSVIMGGIQTFRKMADNVLEVDTQMTELKRVTDLTAGQYNDLYDNMIVSAKEYGATLSDIISSTADWSRAGFDANTANGLAEITMMYEHIADIDYDEATKNLLTTYKGFQNQLDSTYGDTETSVNHIADVLNELDNNYSVTAAGVGEALRRSAASMDVANNSFEQTAALVTGAVEVTQDPEGAGNALKVVSMRLRGAKGELEELGEEVDDNVTNLTKMQGQILNLTHGKVNIFEDNGDFKSTYEILQGIHDVWDDLNDIEQADLLENVAGKHRANTVASILANWDDVEKAYQSTLNSTGSAAEENAKYMDSLQGKLNNLTTVFQSFSNTVISSDFLKGFVDAGSEALDILDKLISKVGLFPTLLAGVSAALTPKGFGGFFKVIEDEASKSGKRVSTIFGDLKGVLNGSKIKPIFNNDFETNLNNDIAALENYKAALADNSDAGDAFARNLAGASTYMQEYAKSTNEASLSAKEFATAEKMRQVAIKASNTSLARCRELIVAYNDDSKRGGLSQQQFIDAVKEGNSQLASYLSGLNGAKGGIVGYTASLIAAKAATIGLQVATMALNAVISLGIGMAIQALISWVSDMIHAEENLAEKVDEVTQKYSEQQEKIKSAKSLVDEVVPSNGSASRYQELAKGVDAFGRNISLTTDEYAEYNDIVGQIANTFPELVQGFNSEGNAILSCKDNVDALTDAYKNMQIAANKEFLDNDKDIAKDFQNNLKDVEKDIKSESVETLKKFMASDNLHDSIFNEKDFENSYKATQIVDAIKKAYKDAGIEDELPEMAGVFSTTRRRDFIEQAISQHREIANEIVSNFGIEMKGASSDMQTLASTYLSDVFLKGNYPGLSSGIKSIASEIVSGFDLAKIMGNSEDPQTLYDYIDSMLKSFDNLSEEDASKLEKSFNLKTEFNDGKMTFGEYKRQLEEVSNIIDSSNFNDDIKSQLKLSLNVDDVESQWQTLVNRMTETKTGMSYDAAVDFANSLNSSEWEAVKQLVIEGDIEWKDKTPDEIKAEIQKLSEVVDAMNFTIDIDTESDSLDKLNSALTESKTATGLTSESMDALKSRYQGLKDAGYDASKLFEETSNGVRLNTEEYTKLERAYAQGKLDETTDKLNTLKSRYDELTGEIATCTDAETRANKVAEQENIRQKINDLGELAAQYEGLTSKYNAWQNAESAGSDRDMYENVLKGFEEVDDELSRGWLDDASKAFIDMFSYDQLNSIDDYTNRWKTLGDTIEGTTYSAKDFFTQNEDGESTNDGVYNFLDAVDQLGQGNIKRGDNGEIISFDFGVNGEDAIAKTMGISKELVQIIERAAEDAGFVINMDGAYTQFADLQNAAVESSKNISELANKTDEVGIKLKELGLSNYEFHFDSTDANVLLDDLNKAKDMLNVFRNEDGTINLEMDGAQDALNIASTLQVALDELADPVYMELDTSQVEDDMKEPLQLLQEYRTDMKKLNQVKLQGADTSELDKSMDEIVNKVVAFDDDTKVKLGIDVDASKEDIEKQLQSGELTVDATVDLQVEMSKDLQDIRLLLMNQAGLLSDDELKLSLALDTTNIDKYTEEQQTAMVKFLPENTDFLNELGLDDGQKEIVVDFVTENSNILESLGLDDGQKKVLLDFVAKNSDFLKDLNDDEKKVIIDFVAKNPGFFDEFEGEDKTVAINFVAKNQDVLSELDSEEDKKVVVDYFVKNPDALEKFNKLSDEDKKIYIESIVSGQEGINTLQQSLDGLSDEQIQVIAQTIGNIDVEQLKTSIGQLDDKTVQAIATALGEGDVQGLQNAINGIPDQKVAQAIAEAFGFESVEQLNGAIGGLDGKTVQAIAQTLGIDSVEGLKGVINGLDSKTVQAIAQAIGSGDVTSLQNVINSLTGKTVNVVANLIGEGVKFLTGGGGVDGTAHVNGTAFVNGTTGKAFKQGDWGTKEDGVALGGELGTELLVFSCHIA